MLVDASGQASSTAFTPISTSDTASLMCARPHTGRTHQIRVHAAAVQMPIAGDDRYGDREFNRELRKMGLSRLFLHARSLKFKHPITAQTLRVQAPLPDALARIAEHLGLVHAETDNDARAHGKPQLQTSGEPSSNIEPANEDET